MKNKKVKKIFSPVILIVLTVAFILIWASYFMPKDENLHITFFDVGQGDSAYVKFPDGKTALIDGGPGKEVLEDIGGELPFFKRKIDVVFLSHPHADHVSGLAHILKRYEVGRVVLSDVPHDEVEYDEFLYYVEKNKIPVTKAVPGTEIKFSDNGSFRVLSANKGEENLNNSSMVLLLDYNNSEILFTGDIEEECSTAMVKDLNIDVDVIKVPHHGASDAFSKALYEKTSPEIAVISVGGDNSFGHPSDEVISFLENSGIQILRTNREGNIHMISDGESIEIEEDKGFF